VQRDDVWLDGRAAIDSCDCQPGVVRWSVVPDGHDSDSGVQHGCVPPTADASAAGYGCPNDDSADHGCAYNCACACGLCHGQLD